MDYVDEFAFDADEQCIVTWAASLRHRTRSRYWLSSDDQLTIELEDERVRFNRARRPRTGPRHKVFQTLDPDEQFVIMGSDPGETISGRDLRRMMDERDEQACRAAGITRESLENDRALGRLWAVHSLGPFRSFPHEDFLDLLERGANINTSGDMDETYLMVEATGGRTDVVRFLLENGADVNARDMFGWTALKSAACAGRADTVRVLLNWGADPMVAGSFSSSTGEILETPLDRARREGHTEVVELLETVLRRGKDD